MLLLLDPIIVFYSLSLSLILCYHSYTDTHIYIRGHDTLTYSYITAMIHTHIDTLLWPRHIYLYMIHCHTYIYWYIDIHTYTDMIQLYIYHPYDVLWGSIFICLSLSLSLLFHTCAFSHIQTPTLTLTHVHVFTYI